MKVRPVSPELDSVIVADAFPLPLFLTVKLFVLWLDGEVIVKDVPEEKETVYLLVLLFMTETEIVPVNVGALPYVSITCTLAVTVPPVPVPKPV